MSTPWRPELPVAPAFVRCWSPRPERARHSHSASLRQPADNGSGHGQGQGHTAAQLQRAGWTCMDQGDELPTPCLPDGDAVFSGEAPTSIVKTFGPDGIEFWGTELLVHEDLYNDQPCPQDDVEDGDGRYIYVFPLNGLPYYVCHHFDSPVT